MDRLDTEVSAGFQVRFWGVRGSVPTPCAGNLGFGGNTPCVEVCRSADEVLVLDAGTGIRALGGAIAARAEPPRAIHIFLTHFHWDHVQGLPFFAPLYSAASRVVFHSVHAPAEVRATLAAQMRAPYFPIGFDDLPATMEFRQLGPEPVEFDGLTLTWFPLHHPQGSVGFRIAHPQKTVVYATDHEHGDAAKDRGLREVASEADALIYDAQYTPAEYESRRAWGHSTWLEATRVARDAGVERLLLFHHDPDRDDEALARIVELARAEFPTTIAAHESLTL